MLRVEFDTTKLRTRLDRVGQEIRDQSEITVRAVAERAVEEMRRRVPVDTGRLRDSIHVDVLTDGVMIRAGEDYAWFVEYGTLDQRAAFSQLHLQTPGRSQPRDDQSLARST